MLYPNKTDDGVMSISERIRVYWVLTKPRLWMLLLYTGIAGYVMAAGWDIDIYQFLVLVLALYFGTAGANTVTSYIDRDIDSKMIRTMNRPLPRGLINPPVKALYFGLIYSSLSLILSYSLGILPLIFMAFGLVDNIIIYSYLTKRRTSWNVILGSFSGGAPVVIGYTAAVGRLDLIAIIWAGLIVIWTPIHIWSLALFYRDDYRRAGVPMLPTVTSRSTAMKCIASSAIILVTFSYLIPILNADLFSPIYFIVVTVLNALIVYYSIMMFRVDEERIAWRLFKLTSPYLGVVFTLGMLLTLF